MVDRVLRGRRELGFDVELADRLAEEGLDEPDPALPAVPQRRSARERAGVEVEVLFDDLVGEQGRRRGEHRPSQPHLERLEVGVLPHLGHAGDVRGLADDDGLEFAVDVGGDRGEPRIEVEPGAELAQLRERVLVVRLLGITGGHAVPVVAGECGLERHDLRGHLGVGDPRSLTEAGESGHPLHMREELLPHLGEVVVEVVVLVGQGDPGLDEVEGVDVGVLGVGGDVPAEQPPDALGLQPPEEVRELRLRLG